LWRVVDLQDVSVKCFGERVLYHTDLARIRSVVEEGALSALHSVRPGKKKKPSVPADAHEALLREKEEVEKALSSLAMVNQALKKAWRGGSRGR
jgi:hypothetical protein